MEADDFLYKYTIHTQHIYVDLFIWFLININVK